MTESVHLIFGATGGIGSALARELAGAGATVVAVGRNTDKLTCLAQEVGVMPLTADGTRLAEVEGVVASVMDRHGRLDGVANCIGSLLLKPAHLTTETEWTEVLSVNLTSSFLILRTAAKAMMNAGGGSIVLTSTAAVRLGLANHEAIAAAKGGVEGLVRAAAASYAHKNVRINAVAPGLTQTPLTSRLTSHQTSLKASLALHALGRIGTPDEVARAMAFLLNPQQSWITGQILGVDGGLSSVRSRS
jgi:NAD(P)-dependent dehydrogenase (short-subunit alcohol dehydrogenase family)